MDPRRIWTAKLALLSVGNLGAAYLSDWSPVFVAAALGIGALAVYNWFRPRRRSGGRTRKRRPGKIE